MTHRCSYFFNPHQVKTKNKFVVFTLVEALVVIALFGILFSLLMPQLKSMMNLKRKVLCLNQLRTIYQSTAFYADDNFDLLPYRTSFSLPHNIVASKYDFNKSFIQPYAPSREIFFCPSELTEARNPQHPMYVYSHVTYQYFNDSNSGTAWKAEKPNMSKLSSGYSKRFPLWGCLTLSTGFSWFGHDRPIVTQTPEGINACFLGGSANWTDFYDMENFFNNGGQKYYWPKPN